MPTVDEIRQTMLASLQSIIDDSKTVTADLQDQLNVVEGQIAVLSAQALDLKTRITALEGSEVAAARQAINNFNAVNKISANDDLRLLLLAGQK